jgi:hypothetical protein
MHARYNTRDDCLESKTGMRGLKASMITANALPHRNSRILRASSRTTIAPAHTANEAGIAIASSPPAHKPPSSKPRPLMQAHFAVLVITENLQITWN